MDDHTAQEHLTPEARRKLLRAFADRMLMKISAMDVPEDLPSVERAVRVAAVIERLYSRCDRAECHAPDPRKLEAVRAVNETEAIKARVNLASTLEWGEKRRQGLGKWWDAAQNVTKTVTEDQTQPLAPVRMPPVPVSPQATPDKTSQTAAPQNAAPKAAEVTYVDYTNCILKARADLGLKELSAADFEEWAQAPPPPI